MPRDALPPSLSPSPSTASMTLSHSGAETSLPACRQPSRRGARKVPPSCAVPNLCRPGQSARPSFPGAAPEGGLFADRPAPLPRRLRARSSRAPPSGVFLPRLRAFQLRPKASATAPATTSAPDPRRARSPTPSTPQESVRPRTSAPDLRAAAETAAAFQAQREKDADADTKAESARTPSPAPGDTRPCPAGLQRRSAPSSSTLSSSRIITTRPRSPAWQYAGPESKPAPRPLPS